MTDRPAWMAEGLCVGQPLAVMFPVDAAGQAAAARICRPCPVIGQCLEWALEHEERWGTWGGTSEYQRVRLRQRRRVA